MKRKFILASHGTFAEGIKNALETIVGKRDDVEAICAYVEEEDVTRRIAEEIEKNKEYEIIVITDILGGSVNNEFMGLVKEEKFKLISGLNLPLLIELVIGGESNPDTECLIRHSIEQSQKSIAYCNELLVDEMEEENF